MSGDTARKAPVHDALPVDLDYVTEELNTRARTELNEDEKTRAESLELLRSMLEKEQNLRWQDDDLFLLAFLRARKFDVERAFRLVKGFYTNFGKHGDLYYNVDFECQKRIREENLFTFLPYRDDQGSAIFMFRCALWDPEISSAQDHVLSTFLGIVQALRSPSTQIAGFQMIADFKDYSLKQVLGTTPSVIRFFTDMIQNALPVRMRGFHVVNQSHLFSYIWPVVKIFFSKKLRDRIHFHGSDLRSLHAFFRPSLLPADLGGELPPFDNTDWRQRMEASEDYLKHVLSFGYENYLSKHQKKVESPRTAVERS